MRRHLTLRGLLASALMLGYFALPGEAQEGGGSGGGDTTTEQTITVNGVGSDGTPYAQVVKVRVVGKGGGTRADGSPGAPHNSDVGCVSNPTDPDSVIPQLSVSRLVDNPDGTQRREIWSIVYCGTTQYEAFICVENCPPGVPPEVPPPPPDGLTVARMAFDSSDYFPLTISTSPSLRRRPPNNFVLTQAPMFFWIDPIDWRPVIALATACIGVSCTSAVTTSTPVELVFQPSTIETRTVKSGFRARCVGPGSLVQSSADYEAGRTANSCKYTYRTASSVLGARSAGFPARLGIRYAITWRSTLGTSGTFPDVTVYTPLNIRVGEVEAIGTGRR